MDYTNGFRDKILAKTFTGAVIVLVLIGGIIVLGRDMEKKVREIRSNRQGIADRLESLSSFASLRNQEIEARSYSSILNNLLPERDRLIDFPGEMEHLAQQSGVEFGFSFGSEIDSAEGRAGKIGFSFNSKGEQRGLFDFIKLIEGSRFLVNLRSLEFVRQPGGVELVINGDVAFQ